MASGGEESLYLDSNTKIVPCSSLKEALEVAFQVESIHQILGKAQKKSPKSKGTNAPHSSYYEDNVDDINLSDNYEDNYSSIN